MPAVTVVNQVGASKPGAVTLLSDPTGSRPVLSYQRFGAGRTAALLAQDSWIWQMHADMSLEDQSHEAFWRQLLRWLSGDSPGRLTTTVQRQVLEPGETLELDATARDARFSPSPEAVVTATLTSPSGIVTEEILQSSGDGRFGVGVDPTEAGLWRARVVSVGSDDDAQTDEVAFAVEASRDEFYDPSARRETLARIATTTRGRSYDPSTVRALPDEIVYASSGATTRERKDLWDAPAVLFALLAVLGAEWAYRRWRGLA